MPNPSSDFPTQLHDPTDISAVADDALGDLHVEVHGKVEEELVAVEAKLGIGASPAASADTGQVLTKQSDGSTAWEDPTGGGSGDVVGPAGVTDDLPAIFDGVTGKLIKSKTYTAFKILLALVKGDVGLGNVDNTSDANKPVSSATQTALNAKQDSLGYTAENTANKDIDSTMAANSDTKYPSQKAVKTALAAKPTATLDTDGTLAANSDSNVPSQKAVKTYADTKQAALGFTAENVANKDTDSTFAANSDTKYPSQKAVKTAIDAKRTLQRLTFSNAAYVISATKDAVIAQIGTMSASRAVTLPAANSVAAGTEFMIMDSSGSVTATNTIVITRAGSDTINGATTDTISTAYGWRRLISDGTSQWSVDAGIVRQSQIDTDATLLANSDTRVPSQKAIKTMFGNRYVTQIGLYKQPISGATATSAVAMSANRAYFHMFQVPKPGVTTLTDILIELTTGSAATGRFAAYYITDGKNPANGITLIADLGTVDLTTTAVKETTVSQVINYDWLIIGVYCPSASPIWRGLNSTNASGHWSFQQIGYHNAASYTQFRPIVGWYISSIDYSAGFPSSIVSLNTAAGGANATPLILARFSY